MPQVVDEICPEYLQALDAVYLSWVTCLCVAHGGSASGLAGLCLRLEKTGHSTTAWIVDRSMWTVPSLTWSPRKDTEVTRNCSVFKKIDDYQGNIVESSAHAGMGAFIHKRIKCH